MYEKKKQSDSNSDGWIFLTLIFYDYYQNNIKKPIVGVEPTTFYLQGKCSTN